MGLGNWMKSANWISIHPIAYERVKARGTNGIKDKIHVNTCLKPCRLMRTVVGGEE